MKAFKKRGALTHFQILSEISKQVNKILTSNKKIWLKVWELQYKRFPKISKH